MFPLVLSFTSTFSWNLLDDLQQIFRFTFMQYAFEAGTIVAIVAGVVGFFVVLRNLSFAGHALSHSGFAGATAAVVLGIGSLYGLLIFSLGGALVMGFLGKRMRGRDIAVGIVLAWTLGLGVFFLSLYAGYANEAYAILFGEILGISQSNVQTTLVVSIITLVAVALIYRPLLFTSLDEEIAEARGVPTRLISILFMVILALAVAGASMVVGVLLIFALLVTPAAIAERLSTRPPIVLLLSVVLSVLFTWVGLLIAYYFPYPVSFFITSLAFATYLVVRFVPFAWTRLLALTNHEEEVEVAPLEQPAWHTADSSLREI
jgi:zinc/manganese transport system permease protein